MLTYPNFILHCRTQCCFTSNKRHISNFDSTTTNGTLLFVFQRKLSTSSRASTCDSAGASESQMRRAITTLTKCKADNMLPVMDHRSQVSAQLPFKVGHENSSSNSLEHGKMQTKNHGQLPLRWKRPNTVNDPWAIIAIACLKSEDHLPLLTRCPSPIWP